MSRTIPSFAEEGLKRFLHGMDRRIKDLERGGSWRFDDEVEHPETSGGGSTSGVGQVLALSATGDSIASGGDYVTFDTIADQHGFDGITAAGSSITLPTSAVYVVTYSHAWDTYTDGGTAQLELDGVLVSSGIFFAGSAGEEAQGTLLFYAAAGSVAKIKVTQSSGSAELADCGLWVGISDRSTGEPCLAVAISDNFNSGSASGSWTAATGAIATSMGPDGSHAWDVSTGAGGTTNPQLYYSAPAEFQSRRWVVTFDFYLDNYPASTADHVLLGPAGDIGRFKTDISSTGQVLVTANGLRHTSAAGTVVLDTWQSWEIDATLGASDGVVSLTIDGSVVYQASGFGTATAGQVFGELILSIAGSPNYYDNIVLTADACA